MYFGDPFGHGERRSNGLIKPILYHIFPDAPLMQGQQLRSKKYWQSNFYPGSSRLIFEGIEAIYMSLPDIPPKPWRLFFWNYATKFDTYQRVRAMHKRIASLKDLAARKQSSTFSVP